MNLGVIFLFSWLKAHLVDVADSGISAEDTNKPFWTSLYQVSAYIMSIRSTVEKRLKLYCMMPLWGHVKETHDDKERLEY